MENSTRWVCASVVDGEESRYEKVAKIGRAKLHPETDAHQLR